MSWNLALIGQEAAFARGGAGRVPDPTGPRRGGTGRTGGVAGDTHPLQPLAGTSGARFAGISLHFAAGWVPGITLPQYPPSTIPTRYTHPVHPYLYTSDTRVLTARTHVSRPA